MPRRWKNTGRTERANMWPLAKELHDAWNTTRKPPRLPRTETNTTPRKDYR